VNAFVHAGMKKDSLMLSKVGKDPWIHKVRGEDQMAATASIGLITLWDFENSQADISEYLNLTDGAAKMGACLGIGMSCSGIISEFEPAKALLTENLEGKEFVFNFLTSATTRNWARQSAWATPTPAPTRRSSTSC
jgi:26S proteasome regulatory subunit N1